MASDPRSSRPPFPPGYGVPATDKGLIPWAWAREQLVRALTYWLVTARPDGSTHAIPTWGVWVDDRFYCEGSPDTVYGRNIARDARVLLHLPSGDEVVIVEGEARLLREIPATLSTRIAAAFEKYVATKNYTADPELWPGGMWEVRPRRARGWRRLDEATRWTFEDA